ncbi:DUF5689 domain-containing protein [Flavobacterium sp.]|uniref:DUF5689 domain-containing protein n=1 Tax=Flavobacterium sp. TaxID=239 RepID=UPI004048CDCF
MKNLKLILTTAVFATLTGCVNGDDYGTPDLSNDCITEIANKEVSEILAMATTNNPVVYTTNDVIEAYVTSSDEGGNFYKSISFVSVDGANGFTMSVDDYNLYTKFEPGRKVYVHLKDLYYSNASLTSSLEIGGLYIDPTYGPEIGRISGVMYKDVILRSCDKVNEETLVQNISLSDINDTYLHKLVEFDGVQFSDLSVGHTYFDRSLNAQPTWTATNHTITDMDGNTLTLRASEYATFASNVIPENSGKIRGVLTKYNGGYQLMIRTLKDVNLTNPRIVPLFEETFTSNWNGWTKYSVTGAQVWTLDTQYGNPGNCAKMSGYSGGNQTNEDWLISPSINLSSVSSASLNFQTASKFPGNLLEAKISTNYSGTGNPNLATWTNLTATLDTNTGSYIWTNSGSIDISAYTGGNVYIAFKYTSTTSAASTWEVDNVKIQ